MVFVDKEGGLAGCKMLAEGIFGSSDFLFSSKYVKCSQSYLCRKVQLKHNLMSWKLDTNTFLMVDHRPYPFIVANLTVQRSVDPVLLAEALPNQTCFHKILLRHKQKKRLSLTCAGFRNLETLLAQVPLVSRSLLTVFSELAINGLLTSNDTRSSPKHFSRNDNTLSGRLKIPNEVLRGTLGDT
ncbi:hypothetical protein D5086_029826 [Populus alba]|uniref:Uncharacterized protein n=1 Tax=Populus alba TaxID=43335 RepID=A0ACC4AUT2_POPAL